MICVSNALATADADHRSEIKMLHEAWGGRATVGRQPSRHLALPLEQIQFALLETDNEK